MRTPKEIKRHADRGLEICWSDGATCTVAAEVLRRACPCAECRESRGDSSHAKPLTPTKKNSLRIVDASKDQQIKIESIWAVGNYAIGISWGDGHDTGIYTFDYLDELGNRP